MATLLDIAHKAGVAKSTVSRALRNDPTLVIADKTKEKIFAASSELNYHIKQEKLLVSGKKIAIIHKDTHFLNQVDNAYYFSERSTIEETCHKLNMEYTFIPLGYLKQLPLDINGIIIAGNFSKLECNEIYKASRGLPLVFSGTVNHLENHADWITYDVEHCVALLLTYLKETNNSNIVYLGGHDATDTPPAFSKLANFKKHIEKDDFFTCCDYVEGEHGTESGYTMMTQWLALRNPLPDVIFASNDPIAIGALRALNEQGVQVPNDVSIISINGDNPGEFTAPPLTTIDVQTGCLGREAVLALKERLDGARVTLKKVVYSAQLVVRKSVKRRARL